MAGGIREYSLVITHARRLLPPLRMFLGDARSGVIEPLMREQPKPDGLAQRS